MARIYLYARLVAERELARIEEDIRKQRDKIRDASRGSVNTVILDRMREQLSDLAWQCVRLNERIHQLKEEEERLH